MKLNIKQKTIVYAAVTIISSLFLTSVIDQVKFKPAVTFNMNIRTEDDRFKLFFKDPEIFRVVIKLIGWLIALIGVICLILIFIFREFRKKMIVCIISIGIILLLFSMIREFPELERREKEPEITREAPEMPLSSSDTVQQEEEEEFTAHPSKFLILVISIVVVLAIGLVMYLLVRIIRRALKKPHIEAITDTARNTLESLHSGSGFRNTVIRCYVEMSRIVGEKKGIKRRSAMTPGEFEDQLIDSGLPASGVKGLTRLFERVRYGSEDLSNEEEQNALDCLSDIARVCKDKE